MAFRSNGPVMLALPPFRGFIRLIILAGLAVFFALLLCGLLLPGVAGLLVSMLALHTDPAAYRFFWQFVTYPFLGVGLLSTLFALLTIWFFGASLESDLGSRWMREFFLVCTVAGGVLAALFALLVRGRIPGFGPGALADSLWPFSLALLLAFARLYPEQEISFNFLFRLKAKYLAAIYLLVYLAILLVSGDRFQTAVVLTNAVAAWLYLQFAPRRGLGFASAESWYSLRNAWYRGKRRRAAKKFTVYMQKQGRDVRFDKSGRYLDPDAERRDPNDRRWMN